ncbi:hypothetical protein MPH_00928 [Macrophomina phaseolina MS6]|uniref:Uncharacterized protein n=1 Tax=Macrophomina phaseolina (strain MS6) TaxID=1126212 RepID=K2S439_MACPH|nr:hypothetical protein MPH_00928 [Macrophomina phaseolina MS6]
MTTSLAILPTAAQVSQAPAVQAPQSAPVSQPSSAPRRPKLSLNTTTAQHRTFGKGSSLRLETLSAVSPTARNTFSNGYEPQPLSASDSKPWSTRVIPEADTPSSASTFNSTTSASSYSSLGSDLGKVPYKLPHNVQSILSNSPLPPVHKRTMASRPMFPAAKRVSFRANLTEEIVTTKYTMAHSDIASSSSTISSLALDTSNATESEPSVSAPTKTTLPTLSTLPSRTAVQLDTQISKPAGSATAQRHSTERARCQKRESPSDSESDSDSCPETPVAGRRKRRREWKWTLGPIDGQELDAKYLREEDEVDSDPDQDRLTCQQRFAQFAERRQSDASDDCSVTSPTSSVEDDRR